MSSVGYIDENGNYVKGTDKAMPHDISPQYKGWSHDDQRRRMNRDIIQPYVNGEPNRDFVNAYPEESKTYFNQNQIDQAQRKLS